MIQITYPAERPAIRSAEGKEQIFCRSRKKWVVLTPEEWVRQNFLNYLEMVLEFPMSLIAVEKQLQVESLDRRFDMVVFDRTGQPFMVVECKEMETPLTEEVLSQALRYNIPLRAPVLVLTNGIHCVAFHFDGSVPSVLSEIPSYRSAFPV